MRVYVRWMVRRDMPEVLTIERASFVDSLAWTEENFLAVLRQRHNIGMVAEYGDRVVGFMVYGVHHEFIELYNIAVDPKCRRQSVGRQLVMRLFQKLSARRQRHIYLLTRETNTDAHLFLRAVAFRATGVERDHFEDTGEDAYRFEARYEDAESVDSIYQQGGGVSS